MNFPRIFLNFYIFVFSYFHSGVFLIRNKICRGVPPVSLSLSTPGPLISALSPPSVPHAVPGRHGHAPRPRHKGIGRPRLCPKPRHLRCSKSCCHLAVGAPPDRACPSAAVSTIRVRLTARSRSAPPPIRPSHRRLPCVAVPPCFTPKPVAAPHRPLPICAGAHCKEPPYRRNFGLLHRRDPLHNEQSPEHPPRSLFLRVHLHLSSLFLPTPTQNHDGHRSTHLVGERRRRLGFSRPSRRQEAQVSCRLHPLVWRVTPPPWMLDRPTSATVAPPPAMP
jgi:hypothetical protein